jgi:hypothetical protein
MGSNYLPQYQLFLNQNSYHVEQMEVIIGDLFVWCCFYYVATKPLHNTFNLVAGVVDSPLVVGGSRYGVPEEGGGVGTLNLLGSTNISVKSLAVGSVDDDVGVVTNLLELPLVVVGALHGVVEEGLWVRGIQLRNVDVAIECLVGALGDDVVVLAFSVLDIPLVVGSRWDR